MATTTLHLVRHAEPEPTGEDPKLSESGRAQAAKVAAFRSSAGASEVLHGSRRRSIETATIIGAELGVPATASSHAEDLTPIPTDWDTVPARYHETLRSVPAHEQDLNGTRLDHAYDGFGTLNEQDRTASWSPTTS